MLTHSKLVYTKPYIKTWIYGQLAELPCTWGESLFGHIVGYLSRRRAILLDAEKWMKEKFMLICSSWSWCFGS